MLHRLTPALVLGWLAGSTIAAAVGPLLAMRVDTTAVEAVGPDTLVEVVVTLAPEDRDRAGRDGFVRLELSQDGATVDRVARAVDIGRDGSARLEVPWPPGRYELRVDLESVTTGDTGFWRGDLRVPELEPPPAPTPAKPAPAPEPLPEPSPPKDTSPPEDSAAPAGTATAGDEPVPATRTAPTPVPSTATPPRADDWDAASSGQREVTVTVVEQAQGVSGLTASAFALEVDGEPVPLTAAGGLGTAPLNLVLAVDLSPSMVPYLPEVRRQLVRLALEAAGDRGATAVVTSDGAGLSWTRDANQVSETLGLVSDSPETDLSALVRAAVERLGERPGRTAAVVVTDGGDTADRSAWRRAVEVAESAAGPVYVVTLRGDHLTTRTDRSLQDVAEVTGGDHWSLRDTGLLDSVLGAYRDLLAGSYALRFDAPGSGRLEVEAAAGGWEILHPERLP